MAKIITPVWGSRAQEVVMPISVYVLVLVVVVIFGLRILDVLGLRHQEEV